MSKTLPVVNWPDLIDATLWKRRHKLPPDIDLEAMRRELLSVAAGPGGQEEIIDALGAVFAKNEEDCQWVAFHKEWRIRQQEIAGLA